MNIFFKLMADESGATAIEYGLLAALISVGLIAGIGTFTDALNVTFGRVSNGIAVK